MINKVEVNLISFKGPFVRKGQNVCVNHLTPSRQPSHEPSPPLAKGKSVKHAQGPSTPNRDFTSPMQVEQSSGAVGCRKHGGNLVCPPPCMVMSLWTCVHQSLGKTSLWERKRRAPRSVTPTKSPGQLLCCRSKLSESTASEAALVLTLEDDSSSLTELKNNKKNNKK